MWIGYSYTSDLVKLWAQLDNYNFWIPQVQQDHRLGQPEKRDQYHGQEYQCS